MKKRILLVDDDSVAHFINRRVLEIEQLAAHITTANNGQEAINYITHTYSSSRVIPDIIFLDINMPVMNGFKFIETLRKLSHIPQEKIKIIMLSSSALDKDKELAIQLGITNYLKKPLTSQAIHELFYSQQSSSDVKIIR